MKVQNGTTIMGVELNREFINEFNESEPKFIPFLNEMIPKGSFTYLNAINRIIELNDIFQFDWIAIDRGYGDILIVLLSFMRYHFDEVMACAKERGYKVA